MAQSMGYFNSDGTANVQGWIQTVTEEENISYQLYMSDAVWPNAALKKLTQHDVQVTDEDLKKGFEANFGPRAEVLAIVLSNQRTAEDVFRQLRQAPTEQNFSDLAAKYSVEPVSRANFGKIQPIRRHGGMPTIEREAFESRTLMRLKTRLLVRSATRSSDWPCSRRWTSCLRLLRLRIFLRVLSKYQSHPKKA